MTAFLEENGTLSPRGQAVSIVNGDRLGNRTAVIETIHQPGALAGVAAFLE
ncbi:MAG: hypothetical protein GY805_29105 [Chloroflexi bacterium]|nr:hypothetical protein [Chloroflexota bacterium]